ncbi:potassium voltage-gated channel subfamily G member 4a isoform X2 [Syngnathoides biaculeatus]|uniref:potassium voltage-gated channel subfamily G member 4a isoform X2 n=1 Tax=Syngnathoides biaculeatus TaxID=300417 RepID=UPI002ADE8EF6|nr:potassium voltage-gated channel subfamily G member 4a isoform X2 [Syngnathoides biaculeatus]
MPIISNANHDFSNLSVSDDSSLDRIFTEIPETETIKGVYYQRAQFIRQPEDLVSVDHRLLAVINVGGNRYTFPWTTLQQFPLTRLGRLCGCRSPEDIASVCDDYDEARKEFFFDRSPSAFRVILNFLAAGKLRLLREMCILSLHDELTYWGVEMAYMERCCKRKMYTRIEEVHEQERQEEERRQRNAMQRVPVEETTYRKVMNWLRDMVENPQSGLPGKIFACLSVIMVAVTVVSLCISTMPDLREEEDRGECSSKCFNMFIIETVCVAWFSLEFILRFIQARSKLDFLRGPLNIIDAMAILPYYVSLVVKEEDPNMDSDRPGGGLQTLGLTVRRSTREFGLLLLFLCVAVTLFSPLVHLAESELTGPHDFSSIPASYWWAIISMTTVGYGDMVPRSIPGQVVALSSILSGILIMAFPATSIFHMFSRSYQELKMEHDRLFKEECAAAAAAAASTSGIEELQEAGVDGGERVDVKLEDSTAIGQAFHLDKGNMQPLESLALFGKGDDAAANNHSLPAAAF